MRIQYFDLETDYDFLIIGSGDDPSDSKSVLARLTGNPKLRTLTSTDQVWLGFMTDSSGIATGYIIDVDVTLATIARKGQGTYACKIKDVLLFFFVLLSRQNQIFLDYNMIIDI